MILLSYISLCTFELWLWHWLRLSHRWRLILLLLWLPSYFLISVLRRVLNLSTWDSPNVTTPTRTLIWGIGVVLIISIVLWSLLRRTSLHFPNFFTGNYSSIVVRIILLVLKNQRLKKEREIIRLSDSSQGVVSSIIEPVLAQFCFNYFLHNYLPVRVFLLNRFIQLYLFQHW